MPIEKIIHKVYGLNGKTHLSHQAKKQPMNNIKKFSYRINHVFYGAFIIVGEFFYHRLGVIDSFQHSFMITWQ